MTESIFELAPAALFVDAFDTPKRYPAENLSFEFEVADGAALVFSSNAGYDETRVTLVGSGTCGFDDLCVTDDIVTSDEIVVNAGDVLRIYGNGLTAATRVKLAGGSLRGGGQQQGKQFLHGMILLLFSHRDG